MTQLAEPMTYTLTIKEAAAIINAGCEPHKLKVTPEALEIACRRERVAGAVKIAGKWLLDENWVRLFAEGKVRYTSKKQKR